MERAGFYKTLHGTPPPTNRPRCVVCGDESTGIHYGVNSCEGCKGFFRRCMVKGMHQTCTNNEECEITRFARNSCQYCRFKKCLQTGMSRSASKVGRRPKTTSVCPTDVNQAERLRPASGGKAGKLVGHKRSQSLVPLSLTKSPKSEPHTPNVTVGISKPSPSTSRRNSGVSFEGLRSGLAGLRTSSPYTSPQHPPYPQQESGQGGNYAWTPTPSPAALDFSTNFPYNYDEMPMDYSTQRYAQKSPEDISITSHELWQQPSTSSQEPVNSKGMSSNGNGHHHPMNLPPVDDWELTHFEEPGPANGRYFNGEYYPNIPESQ